MKKLIYILFSVLLTVCSNVLLSACSDEPSVAPGHADGVPMRFEATVIDAPHSRATVLDVHDNYITRDFKAGDSFGLFIIDGDGNFVTLIDGHNAKNIKLTTPDGKAWNLNSDIKEVVHKSGYKYVAYYPYSESFNGCNSVGDIMALLTAPPIDQSSQQATDWMYTAATAPGTNAVTVLEFVHRYAKIDIYNSFIQDHNNNWDTKFPYTKTVDENGVEHYRYIVDAASPTTMSVHGTYSIGNDLTGIKQFTYDFDDVAIENGRHSIVYTYRMDERCAVDLGLPSGIKWSPINLGTETASYMDEAAIAAAGNMLGPRLAWGELLPKDTYNYASYINDPYNETASSLLPADIAGTVYDPAKQYWGGHWTLPNATDLQEFIDNTEIVKTETVYSSELGTEITKTTFRSKINGKEITLLANGYAFNSTVTQNAYMFYMSSTRSGYAYCAILTNNTSLKTSSTYRYLGFNIRPVLKELYTYTYDDKKNIIVSNINDLAVDLGITKTVTEGGESVTYKLLWSPFNYGVEAKTNLLTYNAKPIDENAFIDKCYLLQGMRLCWGATEEPEYFDTAEYKSSAIAAKYNYNNTASTDIDTRDLQQEDDIVRLNWPDGWCIPTARDLQLLVNNTTITKETIDGHTWFRLTASNGNSIIIPGTGYIDDNKDKEKKEVWGSETYLQSSTIGLPGSKPTLYALRISSASIGSLANTAGRPTGLMVRPVRYVRVE